MCCGSVQCLAQLISAGSSGCCNKTHLEVSAGRKQRDWWLSGWRLGTAKGFNKRKAVPTAMPAEGGFREHALSPALLRGRGGMGTCPIPNWETRQEQGISCFSAGGLSSGLPRVQHPIAPSLGLFLGHPAGHLGRCSDGRGQSRHHTSLSWGKGARLGGNNLSEEDSVRPSL